MQYIDDKVILIVSPIHIGEAGTYTYRLYRGEYQKDWTPGIGELIFVGKAFLQPSDTVLKIDVTDIIADQKWIPTDMTDDYYYTDSKQVDIISEYYLTLDIDREFATSGSIGVANIYRYPNRKVYMNQDLHIYREANYDTLLLQGYDPITTDSALTPRIPYISTDKFPLMFTYQCRRGADTSKYRITYDGRVYKRTPFTLNMVSGETFYKISLRDLFAGTSLRHTEIVPIEHYGVDIHVDDYGQNWDHADDTEWVTEQFLKPMELRWFDDQGNNIGNAGFDPGETEPVTYDIAWAPGLGHKSSYIDIFIDDNRDDFNRLRLTIPDYISQINNINFKITVDPYNESGYQIRVHNIQFITYNEVEIEANKAPITIKELNTIISAVLANVDICPSRYYLLWQDRYGSFQSQPFEKVDTYSESFERSEIRNYRNARRNAQIQIQPRWQINSNWIEEAKYPFYESIFTSPYLVLYDTKEDAKYNVLVTESDYVEKTSKNQRKQLFNLTLNLELDRKQNILY